MKAIPLSTWLRRSHLYLALFCLPWFVMYGITALAFNHPEWFAQANGLYDTSHPSWTKMGDWPCTVAVPPEGEISREVAAELMEVAGVQAKSYGAFRNGAGRVEVYFPSFWRTQRLTYHVNEQTIGLYQRPTVWSQTLTGMHARAGYHHDSFWDDAWAVMVDGVVVGFLLWVATGIYMWWKVPGWRVWGALGLVAGMASFVAFLVLL